jgi:hypothetical protein
MPDAATISTRISHLRQEPSCIGDLSPIITDGARFLCQKTGLAVHFPKRRISVEAIDTGDLVDAVRSVLGEESADRDPGFTRRPTGSSLLPAD